MSDPALTVTRRDVLAFRLARHGLLDASPAESRTFETAPVLDLGVPDSGADGSAWALANRGIEPYDGDDLLLAWTLRGAPHSYRRADAAAVAIATAPLSEADARKRVFDASKPLVAAGIAVLEALATIAAEMREIVVEPTPKGEVSTALTALLPAPYLRFCRPCDTTHLYEQPFRLATLQAGLELVPDTSPPVLRRIDGFEAPCFATAGTAADPRHDIFRRQLHLGGPIRQADAAKVVDAPTKNVAAHWPDDVVEVHLSDEDTRPRAKPRHMLSEDLAAFGAMSERSVEGTRLLGPFDPYLQLQDRHLLLPNEPARKDLWRILGRPGAILHDGELVGSWRPRARGRRLTIQLTYWAEPDATGRDRVAAQAERLADQRSVAFAGVTTA